MRPRRAATAVWLLFLLLPGAALVGGPGAAVGPEPQSLEPLSFTIPYTYRTMEGLETHLISPSVTYDHLHDVAWAPDGHMALAVGSHNTLVAWDPVNETGRVLRNGTLGNLYGVAWSDDSQTALAVGWNGALVEYQGGAVTDLAPEGTDVWQSAAYVPGAGFLVVGDFGGAFFLNGSQRTHLNTSTGSALMGVAYSAVLGKALVVGRGGVALEVTPVGAVTAVTTPVTDDLRSVGFESDTGKALVVGGNGVLLTYQGNALVNETHPLVDGGFYDIAVSNSAQPYAIAVRNASVATILFANLTFSNPVVLGSGLTGVEAVARSPASGYVLATGFFGMMAKAWDNGTWTNVSAPYRPVFTDGAWRGAGDKALFVGFNGTVVLYDRNADTTTTVSGPNTTASLRGVAWAQNGTEAIIVGGYSFWRFSVASGTISTPVASPPDLYGIAFRPGGTEAGVVGTAGYIGVWDGAALTRVSSTSIGQGFFTVRWHTTSGVGDYAYAAGANIVARFDLPNVISTAVRIGTFFGVGFLGDDVWVVGSQHQIQRYDALNDIWDNVSLPWELNTTRFTRIVPRPSGDGLLLVGNQTFSAFVNLTKVLRFDTGFLADFNGADYNPVTDEPLFFGVGHLAFSVHEGTFPNLAPFARLTSPANNSNWTTADRITFDASTSSDADGDSLTYSWWDNATGFLTAGASFGAQMAAGNHTLTVFVDDGHGNNVSASVSVSVEVAQYFPVAIIDSPLPTDTPADDEAITFSAASSYDLNAGDTLTFAWRSDIIGPFGNASIVVATLPAGTHSITLTVTDSTGRSTNATLVVAVHVGNFPPSPTMSSPQGAGSYFSNIPILLDGRGSSDPDSTSLTFVWFDNGVEVARGAVNNTTLTAGAHDITLVVSDGAKSAQVIVTITVGGPADVPPRFVAVDPANGTVLTGTVVLSGNLEVDPVGPVRLVEVRLGDGDWLQALGTVAWSIAVDTTDYPNGPINVTFRASDALSVTEVTRSYTVDNPFVNSAPTLVIATPHPGAVIEGPSEIAGTVDDADGGTLTVEYRIAGGAWKSATVTGSTWSATIDPAGFADGPLTIEVRAFDGTDYSQTSVLTVAVENPAGPGGGSDAMLALAVVAVGAVGALAFLFWRRSRR